MTREFLFARSLAAYISKGLRCELTGLPLVKKHENMLGRKMVKKRLDKRLLQE